MRAVSNPAARALGLRLDHLLSSRFGLQSQSDRIVDRSQLPARLENCVTRLTPKCIWRAYRGSGSAFCAIARLPPGDRDGASFCSLEAYFLDDQAAVYSAGVWEHDPARGWWLDSVLDLSYDCEHGWWLGPLMNAPVERGARAKIRSPALLEGWR